jgi:PAS domain S-box-containing protein
MSGPREVGEDALRAAVIRASLDCVIVIDDQGRVVEFNPAAEATFGRRRPDVIGRSLSDMIVPHRSRSAHAAGFARYLAGGAPRMLGRRVETEALRADGSLFPVELAIVEVQVEGRRLFTASLRDLSERRAAEAALRESEARLAAFMQHAPATMFLKDAEGRYLLANQHAAERVGHPVEALIGRTLAEVSNDPDLVAHSAAAERAVLESGRPSVMLQTFDMPVGRVHGLATRFPVPGPDGRAAAVGGVFIDVTAQREAELRLLESETRLRLAVEGARMGTWSVDPQTGLGHMSAKTYEIMGLDPSTPAPTQEERIALIHPEDRPILFDAVAAALAGGGEIRAEYRIQRPDGETRWVANHGVVQRDETGRPINTTGIMLDITERKTAEAELERSREALHQSEKLTALGSLLAGVSHELNNPLAVVVGESIILEEDAEGTPLAEGAGRIRRAAERCARIVQTFLAMARQRKPEKGAVDANALVEQALELAQYGLRTAGVRVVRDLGPGLPPLWADSDQIHQVVLNLLVNAQQALQEQPGERELIVRTERAGPDRVAIELADNGPGVPAPIARRIFEPFFTTKPTGSGTGVGLSFSHGVAAAHGGVLQLVPSERGAVFRLELPIDANAGAPPPQALAPGRAATTAGRALVVDDEPELAAMLARMLSREGYAVDVADGGAAAKARLREGRYDLVLSDLRMPDLDGPALYDWIKAERPDIAERVGFVTGDTLGAGASSFLARAGRPVLEKPFTPTALRALLQQLRATEPAA